MAYRGYRNKEKRKEYLKQYMREYRRQQTEAIRRLRQELPDVYKMLFGTPKRRSQTLFEASKKKRQR
ncbi:MAG: hypothetical protein QXH87_03445 [Candidatus Bathyarchaeia archaeon]